MEAFLDCFRYTGDGVWAVSTEQRILFWNQVAEQILGYTSQEALGQRCYELLAGRDPEGRAFCKAGCSTLQRVQRQEPVGHFPLMVRCRGGRARLLNVSIIPVLGDGQTGEEVAVTHLFRHVADGPAWVPALDIRLLGQVQVQRADGLLVDGARWRRAKVRALLAVLALQQGRPVPRDTLLETLWPDLDYPAALHSLNTTVYRLRRSLEPELRRPADSSYIFYEKDCYVLNGGRAHWLDLDDFESKIAQARRDPDPDRAADLYRQALELYRGEYLADLEPDILECWMERERLRELYLSAKEELGDLHARQQRDNEAADLYRQILSVDNCQEGVAQKLMRLAIRSGNRAAAIRHYRRLEKVLWAELEVLPSQETCLLYELAQRGG